MEAPARTVEHIRKSAGVYMPVLLLGALWPLFSDSTLRSAQYTLSSAASQPSVSGIIGMISDLAPILVMPSVALGVMAGYLLMLRTFNRAVRPLLTARPPHSPNGCARCRTCGGELAVTPAASVKCAYCQATNLLGEELTSQRAALLEREANVHRERAQAFGRALAEPFNAPAQVFYRSAAIVAVSIFGVGSVASVVAALAL